MWFEPVDYIFGVLMGMWLYAKFYEPVLPVKVTVVPPETIEQPSRDWQEAVEPVVAQLTVASHFAEKVTYNKKGAAAIAKLLRDMSKKLDRAVDMQLAERPNFTMKTVSKPRLPS